MTKNEARLMRAFIRWPDWQIIGLDSRATVRTLARHGLVQIEARKRGTPWRARLAVSVAVTLVEKES